VRETTAILVRTLLALGLSVGVTVPGSPEKDRPPRRWAIDIRLTAEGRYWVREGSRSFTGDFRY